MTLEVICMEIWTKVHGYPRDNNEVATQSQLSSLSSWIWALGREFEREKEEFGPLPLSPILELIWVNFLIKEYSMIFPFLLN